MLQIEKVKLAATSPGDFALKNTKIREHDAVLYIGLNPTIVGR
jgi:hypothetical protein